MGLESNIYAIARARTQESIERVDKKRKRTKDTYTPESYEEHKAQCRARSKAYAATPEGKEAHRKTAHLVRGPQARPGIHKAAQRKSSPIPQKSKCRPREERGA